MGMQISNVKDGGMGEPDTLRLFAEGLPRLPAHRHFTDAELELIYASGLARHSQGDYVLAAKVFLFLVVYRPLEVRYLKALGIAQRLGGTWEQALHTYEWLKWIAPNDPEVRECHERCIRALALAAEV